MGFDRPGGWACSDVLSDSPAADAAPDRIFSDGLKLSKAPLQLTSNLVRVLVGGETHWRANRGAHVAGSREDGLALFQIKKATQVDRHNGDIQLLREQAYARAKRQHLSILSRFAFRKNQHAPAAVGKIAREGKAAEKTRLLRERKYIEQTHREKIPQAFHETLEQTQAVGGTSHSGEPFTAHRGGKAVSESCRKRRQNPGDVEIGDVVGDHQDRPL